MSFHSKGHIFHLKHCVYFPILVRIFVGTLDSCFLTHRRNNTTSIHVTLFKNMSKCVFTCIHNKLLTDSVNKVHFGGSLYVQQKRAGREVVFLEHWFAGSGVRMPRREIKGSALDILFWRFKAHR